MRKARRVDARIGPQPEHHRLHQHVFLRKNFFFSDITAFRLRVPLADIDLPVRTGECGMRSGTESYVRHTSPICGVVTSLETRVCEVRHLIMVIAGLCQKAAKRLVLASASLFRCFLIFSRICQHCQCTPLLYRELIRRYMTGTQADSLMNRRLPDLVGQPADTIYKVNADVPEAV